jgi:hypothetical protein
MGDSINPMPVDKPNFNFGDRVINGWASRDNPQREAYFIRYVRVEGRINNGTWAEVTDGKGKVWQQAYDRMELAAKPHSDALAQHSKSEV